MKVVINACYGGFDVSKEGLARLEDLTGIKYNQYEVPRDLPELIHVVEELGKEADGGFGELKIVEIPDDVEWTIEEYDGLEWVAEKHRVWE